MEPRYKNILCEVTSDCETEFMLNDEEGTVFSDSAFFTVVDPKTFKVETRYLDDEQNMRFTS